MLCNAPQVFDFVRVKAPWALNTYTYTTGVLFGGLCCVGEGVTVILWVYFTCI